MLDLDKVLAVPNLPTLPTVAVKVLERSRDPKVDLSELGSIVQSDQALTTKVLRTVNSSYYGLADPCPSVHRAVTYLGLNTVKSLVLGFSLVEVSRHCRDGFDLVDYWRRCLYSAAAARRIAQLTRRTDPEEAFTAALMQDIGMLAMHTALGDRYGELLVSTRGDHSSLPGHEQSALGFSHAEAGGRLGERWRLPDQLVDPIRQHHGSPGGPGDPMVATVVLAYHVSNLVTARDRQAAYRVMDSMFAQTFRFTLEQKRRLLYETLGDARELSSLLEVDVGHHPDMSALMAEADEALMAHQLGVQREAEALRQSSQELARAATTDALTGVGNRKRFDEELALRFEEARRGTPLGLLIADADRFKNVNDTYGHQVGDQVLIEMACRIHEAVGGSGTVCRYGGEEFAAILPGSSREAAARIAERARRAIEARPFPVAPGSLESVSVSASFGVAVVEPAFAHLLARPGQLVQMADRSLYAAKSAGRNCVRVFAPRLAA